MSHKDHEPLVLTVGCEFDFEVINPVAAVVQVAPRADPRLGIRREQWHTATVHHNYIDQYGNRCERFMMEPGLSASPTRPRCSSRSPPT